MVVPHRVLERGSQPCCSWPLSWSFSSPSQPCMLVSKLSAAIMTLWVSHPSAGLRSGCNRNVWGHAHFRGIPRADGRRVWVEGYVLGLREITKVVVSHSCDALLQSASSPAQLNFAKVAFSLNVLNSAGLKAASHVLQKTGSLTSWFSSSLHHFEARSSTFQSSCH